MDCGLGGGNGDRCCADGGSGRSCGPSVAEPRIECGVRVDPRLHEDRVQRVDGFVMRRTQGLGSGISRDACTVVLLAARASSPTSVGFDRGRAEVRDSPHAAADSTGACETASGTEWGCRRCVEACERVHRATLLAGRDPHCGLHGAAPSRNQRRRRSPHRQPRQRRSPRVPLCLDQPIIHRRAEHRRFEDDDRRSQATRAPGPPLVDTRVSRREQGHSPGPVFASAYLRWSRLASL
jgi:hypothetical protein